MNKKVSIITPCFNGEKFIKRFLNSVLAQTYNNIELIIIDDGSEDDTSKIINSYKEKFLKRGYNLIYIYQKNGGQAAALNKGLKVFTGEYLTWPDSDDFLSKNSIKHKVDFLEKNKDYGMVRSSAYMYDEDNLDNPIGYLGKEKNPSKYIFKDLITEKVGCTPGRYMITSSAFFRAIPNRKIYPSRAGQNWQMLLPIAYKYKCGYINEELFNYVVRKDSHSHADENISEEITLKKMESHKDILVNTIEKIIDNNYEKDKYLNLVKEKYSRRKLKVAREYKDRILLEKNFNILKEMKKLKIKDRVIFLCGKYTLIDNVLRSIRK